MCAVESGGQKPGILLNVLQCTGHPSVTKKYLFPDVNSAEVENS